jgi:hypothetical protein
MTASIIDYAYPCMLAENALKDLHLATIHGDYDAAIEHGIEALVEVKLTLQNIRLMKEQRDALRNQTQTI